jgi:hypothetical protein
MTRANRFGIALAAALTVGFTLGCMGGGEEAPVEEVKVEVPDSPEGKAAYVAKAGEAGMAKALKDVGMSEDELDTLLFDIAKDAERTDAYLEAMKE